MAGACLTAAALATAAHAQLEDAEKQANPYQDFGDDLSRTTGVDADTDHTPRGKETDLFELVAGAKFGESETIFGSPTSFADHLYTVAFSEQVGVGGFAGGATCEANTEPGKEADSGDCVPVLYQYRAFDAEHGEQWRKVDLPGGTEPGYVGEVAWIGRTGKALAVGGTGTYPRREPAFDATQHDPNDAYGANYDPAGRARAWLYDPERLEASGGWCELGPSSDCGELPKGMRGLTAVAFDFAQNAEFGFAGALGQLWKWEGDRFKGEKFDMHSPDTVDIFGRQFPNRFRFRVRDIQFVLGSPNTAVAATAGCCAADPLRNLPRVLTHSDGKWRVQPLMWDPRTGVRNSTDGKPGAEAVHAADGVNLQPQRPDSLFSIMVRKGGDAIKLSAIATAGGPAGGGQPEPPSRLTPRYCISPASGQPGGSFSFLAPASAIDYDPWDFTRTSLSTARLVAGDGDLSVDSFSHGGFGSQFVTDVEELADPSKRAFDTYPWRGSPATRADSGLVANCGSQEGGPLDPRDSVPDWVVGELRSRYAEGRGRRGLLVANPLRPSFLPDAIDPNEPQPSDVAGNRWEPTSREKLERWARSQYYLLPSYGLSSIDLIGDSATGWAVGDHGAILKLSAERATKSVPEPEPPRLGAPQREELPDRSPYEPHRPPTAAKAGIVAPLASRPLEQLREPRLVPAGAPAPSGTLLDLPIAVRQIAMSRDGQEGWAIGAGRATPYHYDGSTWSLCDFHGVEGQIEPDPACAELAGLRSFAQANGPPGYVELRSLARVPLERDSGPANDDELELVAIGTGYRERPAAPLEAAILRYRDGRWRHEAREARAAITDALGFDADALTDVAFTAPDDGWILARKSGLPSTLFHFDGEDWADCSPTPAPPECGDPGATNAQRRTVGFSLSDPVGIVAAGERVYLFGSRPQANAGFFSTGRVCPAIVYHERGAGSWKGSADGSDGGFDPSFGQGSCAAENELRLDSLAVGQARDGAYEGWAVGKRQTGVGNSVLLDGAALVRLRLGGGGGWRHFAANDALADSIRPARMFSATTEPRLQAMVPRADGGLEAFIAQADTGRLFRFDEGRERWEPAALGVPADAHGDPAGKVGALAPDPGGGLWVARSFGSEGQQYFFRHTDRPHRQVFEEVPNPHGTRGALTAAAAGPDGSVWLATDSDTLHRYDRLAGWERLRVRGWDPGRVVTRTSHVTAVAVNRSGEGIAVGEGGRIADIDAGGIELDAAAGKLCDLGAPRAPCGTGRHLRAAAVAPDGSAIAAGDSLSLLWRPAGGEFRAIARPDAASQTRITGVAMPQPGRAWITTSTGLLFRGELGAQGQWTWRLENVNERHDLLTLDRFGQQVPMRAIALDERGNGFAVGDQGVILERREGEAQPWRRVGTRFLDDLTAVVLPAGEGPGALVGGQNGVILTYTGERFELARAPLRQHRPVAGLALLPGVEEGQTEAFAAVRGFAGESELLHYASDPAGPLLRPTDRAEPLPDVPAAREGELSLAAFGHTRCLRPPLARATCRELTGTDMTHETYTQRIVDELAERARGRGGPALALFTGDISDDAGTPPSSSPPVRAAGPLKPRRFAELVADRLERSGVPLLGAIGSGDLTGSVCAQESECVHTPGAGENLAWRSELAGRRAPWGKGKASRTGALELRPAPRGTLTVHLDERAGDVEVEDPDGSGIAPGAHVPTGGARTHYAVDVVDTAAQESERIARLVFLDTSLRSLSAADPLQNPLEGKAGQAGWLEEMLCIRGQTQAAAGRCTRKPSQQAIVVSNAPTYSYGPGALDETQVDGTALEALLLRHRANLVVSGRIGWQGRYWASAPGVHEPCPGGDYQEAPPRPGSRVCDRSEQELPLHPVEGAGERLSESVRALGAPPAPSAEQAAGLNESGLLPFVVASGAGRLADEAGEASKGFWHGYTLVRLDRSGDARATIVEQRPVFDWLHISAPQHVLRPGQRMTLRGVGREPVGSNPGAGVRSFDVREDRIDSPAITHRYDLVEADARNPALPREDADGQYVPLDPTIATIDSQSGRIATGRGNHPRAYAIGILSVGRHVATYPLVFEPRRSFRPKPAQVLPALPLPKVAASAAAAIQSPQAPPPVNPPTPQVNIPPPPAIPPLPTPSANPPAPPAPPAPPPPPVSPQVTPLDLVTSPVGLNVAPQATVIPPPAPPIQPAPPGGARREARQRQAATQKSGADGGEGSEIQELGGDLADRPSSTQGAAMTRRDRERPAPSFTIPARDQGDAIAPYTRVAPTAQPSAWPRNLAYGGGLGIAALTLAFAYLTLRPRPRPPDLPAPAQCQARNYRA